MSSYVPAPHMSAAFPEENLDSFPDYDFSGEDSPVENSVADTATSYHSTTPDTEDSSSVYEPTAATDKDAEETLSAGEVPHGYEAKPTPPIKAPSGRNLAVDCTTPDEVKAAFAYTYGQWKKASENREYKPGFDVDTFIIETVNHLFSGVSQKNFNAEFKSAKQKFSWLLVRDIYKQDPAIKVAAAEEVEPRLQEEEQGTTLERNYADYDDGDHDYEEDDNEAESTEEGYDEDAQVDEEDDAGVGHDDEPIEDKHRYEGPGIDESDSSSSSEDGWDWVPKKKAETAPNSRKRSREVSETAEEKAIRWQDYKKRKLAIALSKEAIAQENQEEKEANSCYHPFGASRGLYIGMRPTVPESDEDLPVAHYGPMDNGGGPSRPSATRPSRKRSFTEEDGEPSQPVKKARKTHAVNSGNGYQGPQRPSGAAQRWFLELGKIKPAPLNLKRLSNRPGAKNRSIFSKRRGDWGTPRPRKVSKADFLSLRKHGKYTTKAYDTLALDGTYSLPLTNREALRYEQMPGSNDWKYELERGDISEEDPIIDGKLILFERKLFRDIRRGKKARRERLAMGEDQDSESSLSDDDSQYGDGKATCGWDLEERMEYYLAKQAAKEAGVEDEYDGSDEEDDGGRPRRKNNGKGRAMAQADEEDEDEEEDPKPRRRNKGKGRAMAKTDDEADYEEESPKPRRKNKGKGRTVIQGEAEEDDVQENNADDGETMEHQQEVAVEYTAEPGQTIQHEAQSEESVESEEE
ncbi:hypothetical protein DL98DRAFT_573432 [Cadophora sp. DSE1049]|nr:hypothetical protein DL98DRAFT_573432 [Cadophora sp. DSE1049]